MHRIRKQIHMPPNAISKATYKNHTSASTTNRSRARLTPREQDFFDRVSYLVREFNSNIGSVNCYWAVNDEIKTKSSTMPLSKLLRLAQEFGFGYVKFSARKVVLG